jgi:predicted nucleic acid-binding protein
MTFVDTSGWYAWMVPDDLDHRAMVAWWAANTDRLLTTDYVVDETLTLLRSPGHGPRAVKFGAAAFGGLLGQVHRVTEADVATAWDTFRTFATRPGRSPTAPAGRSCSG